MKTKKVKVSELAGRALDWAVAKCEGEDYIAESGVNGIGFDYEATRYSTNWSQGGPIIEREGIHLRPIRSPGHSLDGLWLAMPSNTGLGSGTDTMVKWVRYIFGDQSKPGYWTGETLLIAAMRCYVASKVGEEINIPEVLL